MSIPEVTPVAESTPATEQIPVKSANMETPEVERTEPVTTQSDEISQPKSTLEQAKETKKDVVVESTPAAEGVLGYKAPGIIQ